MSYPYQIKSLDEYKEAYKQSIEDPAKFWLSVAQDFVWKKAPKQSDEVLNWNFDEPKIEWFKGAKLNITENCLDRHLASDADTSAIIWEPNNPEDKNRIITYQELHFLVNQFAQVLKNQGVQKGDRVIIYMGMVPETVVAMLACARVGAIHSVVFGGFSAQSINDRVIDAQATFVITQDGAYRGTKEIALKSTIDEALFGIDFVKKVVVFAYTKCPVQMQEGRDCWWQDEVVKVAAEGNLPFEAVEMDAEDPLYILYTSGSTGKPKGVVHTTVGYMINTAYSFVNVFQYQKGDIFFCTADVGWVTGHSYIVYGPLSVGATTLLFEGIPTWPDAGRFWDIIDKYKVAILYTAPTAIRSLMTFGEAPLIGKDLSSLKVLGTVGEPINEEAWHWYDTHIGKGECPIVDTWWQTETGSIMLSNLAGITSSKPTYATLPLPGVQPLLVDEKGEVIEGGDATLAILPKEIVSGNLCIKAPWPAMLRTTYGDHERCKQNYFSTYPHLYFTGDGCLRDTEGNYRITGRVDDVLNISGHRIGTAEIENAIDSHVAVIESAVVGYPHDIKGQGMYAYVVIKMGANTDNLQREIGDAVVAQIGAIARPDKIQLVSNLPKTRSGKIMRRILRKIAENELASIGDTSTLLDPAIVEEIIGGRV